MASESFKKSFLDAHNAYRTKHSAPPLSYNSEMCERAQKWADHMLRQNVFCHSHPSDGENLYKTTSSHIKCGHFTQVVWKDSKELGVGVATDGNALYVVGHYRPAGNMNYPNYFMANVLPST